MVVGSVWEEEEFSCVVKRICVICSGNMIVEWMWVCGG